MVQNELKIEVLRRENEEKSRQQREKEEKIRLEKSLKAKIDEDTKREIEKDLEFRQQLQNEEDSISSAPLLLPPRSSPLSTMKGERGGHGHMKNPSPDEAG